MSRIYHGYPPSVTADFRLLFVWRGRSPSHDHEVPPIANAARSTIRKSVPVFAEETGTGTEERRAFGVGSVSKIKSTAVQFVGKVVRRPVSTASWGGVHFFDPVLLIARKNLFYWLRGRSRIVKFVDESFFFLLPGKINICASVEFVFGILVIFGSDF